MILELKKASMGYLFPLVEEADAKVFKGKLVALLGRNGAGKSTLLRSIAGLLPLLGGKIEVDGNDVHHIARHKRAQLVSIVTTTKARVPDLSAFDVVALGRAPYTDHFGRLRPEDREAVEHALEVVGMSEFIHRSMARMSDGEVQRIMISRALAQDTPLVLLDEPTAFLDLPNRYDLAYLLSTLAHEEGKAIIFSTHDLDIALQLCDDIMLIHQPRLVHSSVPQMIESGLIEQLFSSQKVTFDPKSGQVILKR